MQNGEIDCIIIELREPKICAIEFVLKDGVDDKWLVLLNYWAFQRALFFFFPTKYFVLVLSRLKLNQGNFRIEVPVMDARNSCPPVPKDLIERYAYLRWESKGRPVSSSHQQKVVLLVAEIGRASCRERVFRAV